MKKVEISIETNPVFEMLVSLNRIAHSDQMESSYFENAGYSPHPRMTEIIQKIKDSLSIFYRQEISFFFGKPVCSLLWDFVISEGIHDISQLPVKFAELSDMDSLKHLLCDIIESVCEQEMNICQNEQGAEILLSDLESFEQLVAGCQDLSSEDRGKALEFLHYPAEAKLRLVRLLYQYVKVFEPYVAELDELDRAEVEKSRNICFDNIEEFVTSYLKFNAKILAPAKQLILIPNAFSEILTYIIQPAKGQFVMVYGTFISKKRMREKRSEEIKQFLKVLSEEKRIEIIKILAAKPSLGNDLARQVGLTSATASYHMTILLGIGLIDYERVGQRLHYVLKKDVLKDLLDKAYQELTNL
ncbi:MAG: helix-turn-helix transcriptional regulator [Clostridia bacterium]|nr:helix-turn-helix transcriptional regulator [Clostridia bacterium]